MLYVRNNIVDLKNKFYLKNIYLYFNQLSHSSMVTQPSANRPFVPISDNIWSVSAWEAFNDALIRQTGTGLTEENGKSVISCC